MTGDSDVEVACKASTTTPETERWIASMKIEWTIQVQPPRPLIVHRGS